MWLDEQRGFLEYHPSPPLEWETLIPPGQAGGYFSGHLLSLGQTGGSAGRAGRTKCCWICRRSMGGAMPGRYCTAHKALAECRRSSLLLQEVCGLYLALLLGGH